MDLCVCFKGSTAPRGESRRGVGVAGLWRCRDKPEIIVVDSFI